MSLHDDLLRSARRILLQNVSVTDRLIRNLYIRAAKHIAEEIRKAKKGSLTERWLNAYKQELDLEIARMNAEIERAIVAGARNAAQARAEAEAQWLKAVAAQAKVDDSFASVLANVPTDALRAMYDGKLYTDGRMLSRRIWDSTGRLEGNIAEIIQQGVAQKQSPLELARNLEAYVNPKAACPVSWHKVYPDIPFDRKVDYNTLRLARTSISHVYWAADKAAAKKNPLCTGLKWQLSDSHYERQVAVAGEDVCDEYAHHDEGLGVGVYPIDLIPFPHPQCLCYRTEVLPTLEESADMLGKWVRGEAQNPEMDAAFEKWKRENAEELEALNLPDSFGGVSMRDMVQAELDKFGDFGKIMLRVNDADASDDGIMPIEQFERIKKAFARQGGLFVTDEEAIRNLDHFGADAAILDEKTILCRPNPTSASVFEELIHSGQIRRGEFNGVEQSIIHCEIIAQHKLLKYSRAYRIGKKDYELTQRNLEMYLNAWKRLTGEEWKG